MGEVVNSSLSDPPGCADLTSALTSTNASPRSVTNTRRRVVPGGMADAYGGGAGSICASRMRLACSTVSSPKTTSRSIEASPAPASATKNKGGPPGAPPGGRGPPGGGGGGGPRGGAPAGRRGGGRAAPRRWGGPVAAQI